MTTEPDPDLAALFAEAARAAHPTRSAHRLLATRVNALERKVHSLERRLDLVVKLADALAASGEARDDA